MINYKTTRTPFIFLDETGSINDINNRYFGLGMIKVMQPYYLEYEIRKIRQKYNFYDEIKWNTISKNKLKPIKEIIKLSLKMQGIYFSSHIINKDNIDFKLLFNNDPYKSYQGFTEDLILQIINENEILTVIADYINDPRGVKFEVDLKHSINYKLKRLAIAGVYRMDSKGSNMIQLVDLLLGAVVYEAKLNANLVKGDKQKIDILKYIRKSLNITSFENIRGNKGKFIIFRK